jgi:hypothetical protein
MERECGGCPLLLQHAAPSSGDVDSIFANRMQMAGITPHDRIGKTLHKLWYKKKEEEAVVTCVWMLANSSSLGTPGNKP